MNDKSVSTNPAVTPRDMKCMEIWGGTQRTDEVIAVPGIDAWVSAEPYQDHAYGGDIHYVSSCGHGLVARFSVLDVSGHGDEVGPLAHRVRGLMRKHINKLDQTRFARTLNTEFNALATGGVFATALLTTYYSPTDHLVILNAGHPRPLLYRAGTGHWQLLDSETGEQTEPDLNLPLGIVAPTDYVQFAIKLEVDDIVVLYSDALLEAPDGDGIPLGENGLLAVAETIEGNDPRAFGVALRAAVFHNVENPQSRDDVTVIVLHHNGGDPPDQTFGERMRTLGRMIGLMPTH